MAKLHVNLQQGVIEAEGEQDFINRVYEDFKSDYLKQLSKVGGAASGHSVRVHEERSGKKGASTKRKGGPSCADRIISLRDGEKFFSELRTNKQVQDKLSEKATNYAANQVAAALKNLTERKALRRIKKEGVWGYQNP